MLQAFGCVHWTGVWFAVGSCRFVLRVFLLSWYYTGLWMVDRLNPWPFSNCSARVGKVRGICVHLFEKLGFFFVWRVLTLQTHVTCASVPRPRRCLPSDEAGWLFFQTSFCRRWCGPVADKPWKVNPQMKEEVWHHIYCTFLATKPHSFFFSTKAHWSSQSGLPWLCVLNSGAVGETQTHDLMVMTL